ncbi:hypothetical protein FQ775_17740 [Nitratireductor mangrovi]|uniref:Uncharacterized protein n=1 Tax=Nitratireductor mangrovi TaxID=2599600 RepID=A0A5B8L2E2_9HYPH|nr:hypothetical protein [Nitratireductor mangrovi]QDZ02075.1 hypothetical protein FQ775_17740 [Nitratireductor mangrovi]
MSHPFRPFAAARPRPEDPSASLAPGIIVALVLAAIAVLTASLGPRMRSADTALETRLAAPAHDTCWQHTPQARSCQPDLLLY